MTANITEEHRRVAATGDYPIVEVSTRDPWWSARPVADRYEGRTVLGRRRGEREDAFRLR